MTQHIPHSKAGDVSVLEISTQHRWDLRYMLSPPAVCNAPISQPRTISQLLFSFDSRKEIEGVCRDV